MARFDMLFGKYKIKFGQKFFASQKYALPYTYDHSPMLSLFLRHQRLFSVLNSVLLVWNNADKRVNVKS